MADKKSTRFSLDELARQLAESVPQNLKVLSQDLSATSRRCPVRHRAHGAREP
jgi:hypothetical protein